MSVLREDSRVLPSIELAVPENGLAKFVPQSVYRFGLVMALVLALTAAVTVVGGWSSWSGPAFSMGLVCLALAAGGYRPLRKWAFTIWISTAVVAGLVFPQWFIGVGDYKYTELFVPILQLIMFCMGTTLSMGDFARVLRMPGGVAVGLGCHSTIMPLLGYGVAKVFGFPPEIAAGVVLVGVAPSALASNVMSFIAKANVALAVTLTALASLLAPILTPWLMKLLAGEMIEVDAVKMMGSIAKMVVVPVLGGLVFHHTLLHRLKWLDRVLPNISMFGIILLTVLTIAIGRDNLLRVGGVLMVACLLQNFLGYTLGYAASRVLGMDQQSARTVAFAVGMQNCGLVSGIAASLNKVATLGLAPIIFGPIMNTTASILANYWRTHPPRGTRNELSRGSGE